jgi:hypothetical protein
MRPERRREARYEPSKQADHYGLRPEDESKAVAGVIQVEPGRIVPAAFQCGEDDGTQIGAHP